VSAMTIDHANDFVAMCLLAGVLGLVALGIRAMLQHRWNSRAVRWALPPAAEYVAGSVAAVLAAVGTSAMGLDSILVTHGQGVGQPFVFAAAASLAAIALGALARRAAQPQPWRVAD
ncbi:MAG: hypothetical protein JWN39_4426, partial [Ilumatobacteraceae bacterium]|nr:hypothetical protein [Ilumatobacteraceae bacterium]